MINLNNRNYYFSEKYDTTIIELNSEEIKDFEFLELDENNINKQISKNELTGESLYSIQYPKGGNAVVSYGILSNNKKEKKNEYHFTHLCSTEKGSSGSPILLKESKKIIGIHKGYSNNDKIVYNNAYFLNYPINEFKLKLKKKNIDEQILILQKEMNRLKKLKQHIKVDSNNEIADNLYKKIEDRCKHKSTGKTIQKKIILTKPKKKKYKSQPKSQESKKNINNDNENNLIVSNGQEKNNNNIKQKLPPINFKNILPNMNEKKTLNKNVSMILMPIAIYKKNNE